MNAAQWAALVYTAAAESNGGEVVGDWKTLLVQASALLVMLGTALLVILLRKMRR